MERYKETIENIFKQWTDATVKADPWIRGYYIGKMDGVVALSLADDDIGLEDFKELSIIVTNYQHMIINGGVKE